MKALKRLACICRSGDLCGAFRRFIRSLDYGNIDYRLFNGFSFPPKSVCFILSEKCNLRCKMCDIGQAGGKDISGLVQAISSGSDAMGLEDWRSVIRDLAKFTPRPLVLLTGTEPFVSPHADAVIASAVAAGLPLHITTNGVLLAEHARRIVELCTSPFAVDITVSLDGPPEVHDAIRGMPGVYDKAVRGIQALAAAREQLGRPYPRINITCTISNHNSTHLESFVSELAGLDLPVDAITFNHLWFKDVHIAAEHNRLCGHRFPVTEDNAGAVDFSAINLPRVQEQLHAIKKRFGNCYRIHQFPDLSPAEALTYYGNTTRFVFYNRCTAPWRNVAVTPRGRVILSPLCFFGDIGTVHGASFQSLWNGPAMKKLRKLLRKTRAFPACSRCCMLFGSRPAAYKIKDWLA